MLFGGAEPLVATVPDHETRGDRSVLECPGIAVGRGDDRGGAASSGLEPSVATAMIGTAVDGPQPPTMALVVRRRTLGEESTDRVGI
jgi:hypothetical protein